MVQLNDELSRLIEEEMRSGRYASTDEVVRVALANLQQNRREMEAFGEFAPGELVALVEEGERSSREEGALSLDELKAHMDEVERQFLARRDRP